MTTQGSGFTENVREWAQKVLMLAMIPTIGLFAYLLYGLISGQLAGAATNHTEAKHAADLVNQLSSYLNISLVISLLCCLLLFFDFEPLGLILVVIAAILAYGVRLALDLLGSGQLANGLASDALF